MLQPPQRVGQALLRRLYQREDVETPFHRRRTGACLTLSGWASGDFYIVFLGQRILTIWWPGDGEGHRIGTISIVVVLGVLLGAVAAVSEIPQPAIDRAR